VKTIGGSEVRPRDRAHGCGRLVGARRVIATTICLLALGSLLTLAPVAGASPGKPMRLITTKVRLHHGRLSARRLRGNGRRAHIAIVGGTRIAITQAPWQTLVLAILSETEGILCGGVILNETEVLTAGHCVYNPETRERIPADQIVVGAGTADLKLAEPDEQASLASGVRVHPYYAYDPGTQQPNPDDVAVLELKHALVFDTAVQSASLASSGALFGEGTSANLTGFGDEDPLTEELNGELYSIGMTLGSTRQCGGEDDALFICASAPKGSDCFGDSGSGLTLTGSPATVIGVTDTVEIIEGKPCLDGAVGGFANVAAPEIRDFIAEDAATPPRAPRGGGASVQGAPIVGGSLTCELGFWSNDPTFTYLFVDSATGQILQRGSSSTYPLTAADTGRSILCEVLAANAGGTGIDRTAALAQVRPNAQEEAEANRKLGEEHLKLVAEEAARAAANKRREEEAAKSGTLAFKEGTPDATIASASLQASASGEVSVKVSCPAGVDSCAGTVTLRTLDAVDAKAKPAILMLATGSFTVAGRQVKTIVLHLSSKARALLARSHMLHVRVTIVARNAAGTTHTGYVLGTLRVAKAKHGRG
jgi:hypothetical protein